MKKSYRKVMRASNAVEAAAPASVWGKCVPSKFGASTNATISEKTFVRELKERKEGAANA